MGPAETTPANSAAVATSTGAAGGSGVAGGGAMSSAADTAMAKRDLWIWDRRCGCVALQKHNLQ
eukprot:7153772-Lingulodinium_polyedra.AAC.1